MDRDERTQKSGRSFFQETPVSDLTDVLMLLGRVSEGVDRLRQDFGDEKAQAAQNRKTLFDRQDEMRNDLSSLRSDFDMAAVVQAKDMRALSRSLEDHKLAVQPSVEEWKRIKTLGVGITGVLALGGLSVGAMMATGLDALRNAVRSWLGG